MNVGIAKATAAVACAAALALSLAGCSSGGTEASPTTGGITVSASSETKVVPDKARISVSIVSEAKTAEECQTENAESVNAVVEALQALEVSDESIQTTYSDLSPRYGSRVTDGDDDEDDGSYDEWVITGYEMTTSLSISDLEIDNVGTVIQACVAAGANEADGVQYYASDYDEAYNEALTQALETARGKAESIAQATGVGLGKVTDVSEGYQDTSLRYVDSYNAMAAAEEAADSAGVAAKTMPGQVSISAEVTVTYAIS